MNDWVVIGRFGRVHGIKGFIQVHSFTEPHENIFLYQPWHITLKKNWCPITIHQQQISGNKFLVQVENYISREEASFLTNMDIAVPRDTLPKLEEEFYHHDLIGLKVYNNNQEFLGQVSDIFTTGANDVLMISGDKQYLIPFVWDIYVKSIDLDKDEITVEWDVSDTK
jgi:16S rRNA processing protein RimM